MKVKQISFRMNVEVAPYCHEHVEVVVELERNDTPETAQALARSTARRLLGVDITKEDVARAKAVIASGRKVGLV